jgi:ribosomal protein S13
MAKVEVQALVQVQVSEQVQASEQVLVLVQVQVQVQVQESVATHPLATRCRQSCRRRKRLSVRPQRTRVRIAAGPVWKRV